MQPVVTDWVAWSDGLLVGLSVCHSCEPCKNGWTSWDAIWVMGSDGLKELCIRWRSRYPMGRGNFGGKGRTIVKYRNVVPSIHKLYKNGWTDGGAIWDAESGGPKEPCIRLGADARTGRGTFWKVSSPLQSIEFRGLGNRLSCAEASLPILMICMSYDILLHKKVPFGGHDVTAHI